MEFSFTKEEKEFRQELREFLDAEMPPDRILPVINMATDVYRDDVWELHREMAPKLAKKGWLTMAWPKEYGGMDADPMLSAIFQEEMRYRRT